MAEVTVKQLADVVGIPVERLLKQMQDAGLSHGSSEQVVSDAEKQQLLTHLKKSHGGGAADSGGRKITLKRKSVSKIKVSNTHGKSKTVNVEVRKKRTYVKRSMVLEDLTEQAKVQENEQADRQLSEQELDQEKVSQEEKSAAEAVSPITVEPVREAKTLQAVSNDENGEVMTSSAAKQEELVGGEGERQLEESPEQLHAGAQKKVSKSNVKSPAALVKQGVKQKGQQKLAEHEAEIQAELEKRRQEQERARKQSEQLRKEADEKARQKTLEGARKFAEELEKRGGSGGNKKDALKDDFVEEEDQLVKLALEESLVEEEKKVKKSRKTGQKHKAKLAKKLSEEHGFTQPTQPIVREVKIGQTITVADLANQMSIKGVEVVRQLMKMGVMATVNQEIDQETAILVAEEMGHTASLRSENAIEEDLIKMLALEDQTVTVGARAPIVTIMGHVDHGKTSLLDYIRRSKVSDTEAGGITQHIGAYHVKLPSGSITFLDTPGHAAFTAMRARGAKCTDIVILVVAADDGVMPQTEEAIDHARAAEVPIVVAVNKVDKEDSDIDRVKNELATKKNLIPEDWGGDVQYVPVSALVGTGVDELLEAVILQAELLELTAPSTGAAQGLVVESRLEKGKGVVATLLVQKGQLGLGDMMLAGPFFGRVRAMVDENGHAVKSAYPSIPVEVLGLAGVPEAGDEFIVVTDERKAKEVADIRVARERQQKIARRRQPLIDNLFVTDEQKVVSSVNIVLKTDVRGSLEALQGALGDLGNEEVNINIIGSGVGAINESDVNLALTVDAFIVGFNVRTDTSAKKLCQEESIQVRYYSVIYDIINDFKAILSGMLAPELKEKILGVAQVKEVFHSSKFGVAAGCMVTEGALLRNKRIRVLRDDIVVFQGELESLRRFKDDVTEVKSGVECGIAVKNYTDIKPKDQIEAYEVTEVARSL